MQASDGVHCGVYGEEEEEKTQSESNARTTRTEIIGIWLSWCYQFCSYQRSSGSIYACLVMSNVIVPPPS